MPFIGLWLLLGLAAEGSEPAPASAPPAVRAGIMQCGPGVPLCGVLTLETGEGPGLYGHPTPSVHGLWPETGAYGSSACIRPRGSAFDPAVLFPCYAVRSGVPSQVSLLPSRCPLRLSLRPSCCYHATRRPPSFAVEPPAPSL
jgi:hypothetical protein